MQHILLCLMYSSMSFNKFILSCDNHHDQVIECFHLLWFGCLSPKAHVEIRSLMLEVGLKGRCLARWGGSLRNALVPSSR